MWQEIKEFQKKNKSPGRQYATSTAAESGSTQTGSDHLGV